MGKHEPGNNNTIIKGQGRKLPTTVSSSRTDIMLLLCVFLSVVGILFAYDLGGEREAVNLIVDACAEHDRFTIGGQTIECIEPEKQDLLSVWYPEDLEDLFNIRE